MKSIFLDNIINPLLNSINKFSDDNAFVIDEKNYTYKQFGEIISSIRNKISNIKSNSKLGLVVNDDIETYASIFAIWLEGHAYVPLHPLQPIFRNQEIIEQSKIIFVLDSSNFSMFNEYKLIKTKDLNFNELNLIPKFELDDSLAYILFTSGSTGKPKGVKISRKNIGAFMEAFWKSGIEITNNDKCLQCFDLTFDVSIQSFLTPLTKGACTYTVPHNKIKFSYVYGLLENHDLTFAAMPPSLIRYLKPYFDEISLDKLKYSILTAEASPVELINEWSKCIPNAIIYNFYGPTEATIYCSYNIFNRDNINKNVNGMFSIGKLMNGVNGVIIDEKNNILQQGIKGELAVAGDQISPGYFGNKQKNIDSFFSLSINNEKKVFYKTGDSCYFDSDGDIMLHGRIDNQVKIQGYRIELGEIEFHVREILDGGNAIAISNQNESGIDEIILFIEEVDNNKCKIVLDYLKLKLPFYMIPSEVILIGQFPINSSGKVDRIKIRNILKNGKN